MALQIPGAQVSMSMRVLFDLSTRNENEKAKEKEKVKSKETWYIRIPNEPLEPTADI